MKSTSFSTIIRSVNRASFEKLVIEAIESLPPEFKDKLDNLAVIVTDWPNDEQIKRLGLQKRTQLLGLYEGIPRTHRYTGYNLVPPDRITLFQKPIEAKCRNDNEIRQEIIRVVQHEIAHHFGLSDPALYQIEKEKTRRLARQEPPGA